MRTMRTTGFPLVLLLALGCASTKVSDRETYVGGPLPRPGRIIVYDFAATPADLPAWSQASRTYADAGAQQTEKELELGRKLGAEVAKALVSEISAMGLPAVRAAGQPPAVENDLALVGYFASVDKGSTLERVVVGFGTGAADLKTNVEGYHMTDIGMVKLGSGTVASGGGAKGPGMILPAVVTIATANPIGLVVGGAVKATGELTGMDTIEGSAKRTAKKIAEELEPRFAAQGWIAE